jgi:hypothetical protein
MVLDNSLKFGLQRALKEVGEKPTIFVDFDGDLCHLPTRRGNRVDYAQAVPKGENLTILRWLLSESYRCIIFWKHGEALSETSRKVYLEKLKLAHIETSKEGQGADLAQRVNFPDLLVRAVVLKDPTVKLKEKPVIVIPTPQSEKPQLDVFLIPLLIPYSEKFYKLKDLEEMGKVRINPGLEVILNQLSKRFEITIVLNAAQSIAEMNKISNQDWKSFLKGKRITFDFVSKEPNPLAATLESLGLLKKKR